MTLGPPLRGRVLGDRPIAVAVLTPRLFPGIYGVPDDHNGRLMTRMWGTRTAVLGALALTLGDTDDRRTLMATAAAMDAADTLLIASSPVPARARAMGADTTAAFAAVIAYGLTRKSTWSRRATEPGTATSHHTPNVAPWWRASTRKTSRSASIPGCSRVTIVHRMQP